MFTKPCQARPIFRPFSTSTALLITIIVELRDITYDVFNVTLMII